MRPKLTLYLDLHSPFSYLAFHTIENSPIFQTCEIDYIPMFLVGMIQKLGTQPPWDVENKSQYLQRDLLRWARTLRMPMAPGIPDNYPYTTTLKVQRAVLACKLESPERFPDLLRVLFSAFWADHKGVQLPKIFTPIIHDTLGDTLASRVIVRSTSEEIKMKLKENTDAALADGCCGLPWIVAVNSAGETDNFWGFDHLGQVAAFLELERLPSPHL